MTLRRLSSSGTNCRWGNARSSGSHSSRTNSSAQSSSFWYSGSLSKSHAIAGPLSIDLRGQLVVAGDQCLDVAPDDVGERSVAVSACGPMSYTFADVHAGEMGQVAHVDMRRQFAVLLCLREQVTEHVGVCVVQWLAGEDAV